jgi:hypothetical protein
MRTKFARTQFCLELNNEADCYAKNSGVGCNARLKFDCGPVTGQVFGSKTLIQVAAQANPNSEKRATFLFFTFGDGQDQIVALGAVDYPPITAEFDAGQPVVRAVLGGTGRYIGALGQLTSTRNTDGAYTQVFTLLR